MFRLLKVLLSVACLAGFVWFGLTVELGDHTLFGHLRAIGSSRESQELVRGAKDKAGELIGRGAAWHKETAEEAAKDKAQTPKERGERAKEKAEAAAGSAKEKGAAEKSGATALHGGSPQETLTGTDRHQMRRLIEGRRSGSK